MKKMDEKECKIINLNETLELHEKCSINILEKSKISFKDRFYYFREEVNKAIENHLTDKLLEKIEKVETVYNLHLKITSSYFDTYVQHFC
jgi:hypothetical protein